MVHGAISDHSNDAPFAEVLGRAVTTYAMDRRGRGGSGDAPNYAISREFEDVAAVVDAVAARTGERVAVWGHSYGADVAMGAVTLTKNIARLILYEPGLGMSYPPGSIESLETALADGDREAAVVALLQQVVGLTEEEVEFTRSLPTWQARVSLVPTVPRELHAESGWTYEPGQFREITAETLLLAGSESPEEQTRATQNALAAIPHAHIQRLEGHSHIAHRTDPEMISEIVLAFISG